MSKQKEKYQQLTTRWQQEMVDRQEKRGLNDEKKQPVYVESHPFFSCLLLYYLLLTWACPL